MTHSSSRLDGTHDRALRSWVDSANAPIADFPIQNLPLAMFRRVGSAAAFRPGAAIGDQVVDLLALRDAQLLTPGAVAALSGTEGGTLNPLMARGRQARLALRLALSEGLQQGAPQQARWRAALVPQAEVEYAVAAQIGDYTDFYAGIHHATTVGKLFRPDNPLLPNYKWVPIGYHGRSSSIGISGQRFRRPQGQIKNPDEPAPRLAPTQRLDYELELGFFIGAANALGEPVTIAEAEDHWFGVVLLNDWSARDVQAWEYQPLGPFLAKNFATTISPWIVTLEALEPFRAPFVRADGDPQPLPYLDSAEVRERGALDITLEVLLQTASMRAAGQAPARLSLGNSRAAAYWTPSQLITHHTVGGCNLQPGDLLGSGTLSGTRPEEAGSLLELTQGGKQPLRLPNGETRSFLQDGDTLILRGWCERAGAVRIGLGEARGTVVG
ncbi:MAG: fumarylacetoacetase [Janthinobacterium lividum]